MSNRRQKGRARAARDGASGAELTLRGFAAEVNVGDLAVAGVLDLEEVPGGEIALVGDDRGRELLDLRVVALNVRVVDPARGLDLVLELRELLLELLEVLGRAQLGVLLGDHAQPAERRAQ